MTLTPQDQERLAALAALEETPTGTPTGSGETLRGGDAAAFGRQLLLDALGSEEAVSVAVGGRPRLDPTAPGAAPTIRVRVTQAQKNSISLLRQQMHQKKDSDIVRLALDEYVSRHLKSA